MIYINPARIHFPREWEDRARQLSRELMRLQPDERTAFINANRDHTWAHDDLIKALRDAVGNKCWYSEVPLEGADPNVDHFRPKGRVVEVDSNTLCKTGDKLEGGYWWLAFEPKNFRLSCMHSNQRRVDEETDGGKADFFPIEGARSPEGTEWNLIGEDVLPFDPCSATDMALMWFDPDGNPCLPEWRHAPTDKQKLRMKATIWLYHLDKRETAQKRAAHVENIRRELMDADTDYKMWNPNGAAQDFISKGRFDAALNRIKAAITDTAEFAGAKRCAVQIAKADYPWIEEFSVV